MVVSSPRVNVSARSPSVLVLKIWLEDGMLIQRVGILTVLSQQSLEVIQILTGFVLGHGDEESDKKQHDHNGHKGHGVF